MESEFLHSIHFYFWFGGIWMWMWVKSLSLRRIGFFFFYLIVRLNLINHVLALFHDIFACNIALRNPVFRCESCKGSMWESVKKCLRLCSEAGTHNWILREARSLQAAKSWTRAKHAGELNSHASWNTTGQKSRLAIQLARSLNSRLSHVARSSRQPALFWKIWLFAFHSHTIINTPHYYNIWVAIQKEKP